MIALAILASKITSTWTLPDVEGMMHSFYKSFRPEHGPLQKQNEIENVKFTFFYK